MFSPINPPQKLKERFDIRSGTIQPNLPGAEDSTEYGVVFSTSSPNSEDDFDPEKLLGAVVETVPLREKKEGDRFFKILGGYYFKRGFGDGTKIAVTSRLFGVIAKNKHEFPDMKEGGSTTVRRFV